jgi:hypothetical protein
MILIDDSGLGLAIFCSSIKSFPTFPKIDLEFDCRGKISITRLDQQGETLTVFVSIEAGEIKSSGIGFKKGKEQLLCRLLALQESFKLVADEKNSSTTRFVFLLKGYLFVPIEEAKKRSLSKKELEPSSKDFDFKIEYI